MGDEADYLIEQGMCDWGNDELDPDDMEGNGEFFVGRGGFRGAWSSTKKSPTCKYCHKSNLLWINKDGKWRLYDGDEPHYCDNYKKPSKVEIDTD